MDTTLVYCDECGRHFSSEKNLKKHILIHSEKTHVCAECGRTFVTNKSLQQHLKIHTGDRPHKCEHCDKSFSWKKSLLRHLQCHLGKNTFLCEECGQQFSSKEYINAHMITHGRRKPHECKQCGKGFNWKKSLRTHILNHEKKNDPWVCDICYQQFASRHSLINHKIIHNGERCYQCPVCQKAFSQKCQIEEHMLVHGDKKFVCDVCSKMFRTKSHLKSHKISHFSENHVCPICKKTYSRKEALNFHLLSHTEEKPFVCDQCPMAFKRKYLLDVHISSHSNIKPYVCSDCGKRYSQKKHLWAHLKSHNSDRQFECDLCGKSFFEKCMLDRHIKTHSDERDFVCVVCEKTFKTKSHLKKHLHSHTDENSVSDLLEDCLKFSKLQTSSILSDSMLQEPSSTIKLSDILSTTEVSDPDSLSTNLKPSVYNEEHSDVEEQTCVQSELRETIPDQGSLNDKDHPKHLHMQLNKPNQELSSPLHLSNFSQSSNIDQSSDAGVQVSSPDLQNLNHPDKLTDVNHETSSINQLLNLEHMAFIPAATDSDLQVSDCTNSVDQNCQYLCEQRPFETADIQSSNSDFTGEQVKNPLSYNDKSIDLDIQIGPENTASGINEENSDLVYSKKTSSPDLGFEKELRELNQDIHPEEISLNDDREKLNQNKTLLSPDSKSIYDLASLDSLPQLSSPSNSDLEILINQSNVKAIPDPTVRQSQKEPKLRNKKHECPQCGKIYVTRQGLKQHFLVHNERTFVCEVCEKAFKTARLLRSHEISHSSESHMCPICFKTYSRKGSLNYHLLSHMDEKSFVCDQCGASFKRKINLDTHKRLHSDIKPYICEVCNKGFHLRKKLTAHKKIHQERHFICDICDKKFTENRFLERHILTHNKTPLKCDICSVEFQHKSSLTNHLSVHADKSDQDSPNVVTLQPLQAFSPEAEIIPKVEKF